MSDARPLSAGPHRIDLLRRLVRFVLGRLSRIGCRARVAWLLVSLPGLKVEGWSHLSLGSGSLLRTPNGGLLSLGRGVSVGSGVELTASKGAIEIGDCTFIGAWATVVARQAVRIGSHCLIAERVTIRDQDHDVGGPVERRISESGFKVSEIEIGDEVWIGAGAVILKGVRIGRGAVIGANAVVNRDVGDGEIVAGVPARHIGVRGG